MTSDDDKPSAPGSGTYDALLRDMARAEDRAPPGKDELLGTTVGHYRITAKLGAGGMGVVYRATDEKLRREVALKVLPAPLAGDPARRTRLLREARSAAAFNHPNIATVHDVGESGGRVYLAMELVEGTTLRARVSGGALPRDEAVRIAKAIATGLARAHEKGIVHRDLKPENVMLTREGGVKILDFGLAKPRDPESTDSALEHQETQTQEGVVMGTPGYMSPEQAAGKPVDARTDVYALGVVLHEMLTGGVPWALASGKAAVDARLAAIVAKCMARAPEQRWRDAAEVVGALDALGGAPRRTPRLALGALAVVVVAGVVAAVASLRGGPAAPSSSATQSAMSAAPRATAITDLPLPPTSVPEARSEFLAGLQALRDDSFTLAGKHFRRVTELDPSMAAGHLRLAMILPFTRPELARSELSTALSLRSQLTERDQALMEALEPIIGRVHKDHVVGRQRLEAAAARYPLDVEFLDWIAMVVATPARALDAADRATKLDPNDAQAWENEGRALAVLGREDDARRALEHGASLAVNSGDVLFWLGQLDASHGHCEDYERDARRLSDVDTPEGWIELATAGVALGRPEATVRELLDRGVAGNPAELRALARVDADWTLATLAGRFDEGRALADRRAELVAATLPNDYDRHYGLAVGRARRSLEVGDDAGARKVAQDFTSRSGSWTRTAWAAAGEANMSLWLARVGAGKPHAIDADRTAWIDEQLRQGALPGIVWAFAWAAPALTREEANDALDALARDPRLRLPTDGQLILTPLVGIPDAHAGHVLVLAGRVTEAVPYLKRAVASCGDMNLPYEHVHAWLDLGRALEQTGDPPGACEAYAQVLARWGHATPRSVSADAARDAVKRLRCGK